MKSSVNKVTLPVEPRRPVPSLDAAEKEKHITPQNYWRLKRDAASRLLTKAKKSLARRVTLSCNASQLPSFVVIALIIAYIAANIKKNLLEETESETREMV